MNIQVQIATPDGKMPYDCQKAIAEYAKRLQAYGHIRYCVGKQLFPPHRATAYRICVSPSADMLSSEQWAAELSALCVRGISSLCLYLAHEPVAYDGLSPDAFLCLTRLDISVHWQAVVLFEQIYRSFRIRANAPYHK